MRISVPALAVLAVLSTTPALADDGFRVELVAPSTIEVGGVASMSVTVLPSAGARISRDAELRLDVAVTPGAGLTPVRRRYLREHAADPRASAPRFEVVLSASAIGDYQVGLAMSFWLCGKYTCRPIRVDRSAPVSVIAPPDRDGGVGDAGAPPRPRHPSAHTAVRARRVARAPGAGGGIGPRI